MLARSSATLPRGRGRLGVRGQVGRRARARLRASGGRVRLREPQRQRHHRRATRSCAGLGRALGARDAVLDGEIVAFDADGRPSFERLQRRMHLDRRARRCAAGVRDTPVAYVLFDLLCLDGHSLIGAALRRAPRAAGGARSSRAGLADAGATDRATARRCCGPAPSAGSRASSPSGSTRRYEPGRRAAGWLKVKNKRRQEFVIGGWLPGEGRAQRRDRRAARRRAATRTGRCATPGAWAPASPSATLRELQRAAGAAARATTSPFDGRKPPRPESPLWCEPKLVAEVEFAEWTRTGTLRAPSFKGLRDDIDPARSSRAIDARGGGAAPAGRRRARARRDASRTRAAPRGGSSVEVERPHPVALEPGQGPVPGGRLHEGRGDRLLRADRADRCCRTCATGPLTLKRYPDGVDGEYFYEKQSPGAPARLGADRGGVEPPQQAHDRLHAGRRPADARVAGQPGRPRAAHLAVAGLRRRRSPTMLVFDLDPGAPAAIAGVLRRWRCGCATCSSSSAWRRCAKTSGSKGLQVYVPLNADVTYDQTKPFAQAVAELLEQQHPELVVSRMTKALRKGKVLVDWSQNDEHKTTVGVYSLRARERPTVSTPLEWDEVEQALEAPATPTRSSFDRRRRARRACSAGRPVRARARARAGAAGAQRLSVTAPAPRRRARAGPRRGARARPGRPRRRGWTWARCGWRRGR